MRVAASHPISIRTLIRTLIPQPNAGDGANASLLPTLHAPGRHVEARSSKLASPQPFPRILDKAEGAEAVFQGTSLGAPRLAARRSREVRNGRRKLNDVARLGSAHLPFRAWACLARAPWFQSHSSRLRTTDVCSYTRTCTTGMQRNVCALGAIDSDDGLTLCTGAEALQSPRGGALALVPLLQLPDDRRRTPSSAVKPRRGPNHSSSIQPTVRTG